MLSQIGEKLLAIDATEYIRLRAVCKPWRSFTANRPTREPCFFTRNWVRLHEDEDGACRPGSTPSPPLRERVHSSTCS
ncbi:hypothetical protein BDA96_05G053500 [Sorghum bicolor]|uniref:F-box domain-containing protein n=1 Tax=Sorghum bicolor TaxID=4558 RepID=A0A921QVT2_SORBI|nr:hypothetical protein BDA96_05G053500 [Sorghum bicolor]